MHRCTWEPPESFVDDDCLRNWELHKRDIKQPFDVRRFDEAVAREEEQREKRVAKRAEKRRKKLARRLVPRKALKKGVARKADRGASSSSDTESPPRKRNTVLLDPPTPSKSTVQKRKRVVSLSRSPSPALSVNDISNSQYSMFNEPTTALRETAHTSPSTRSTVVPKRARVDGPDGLVSSVGKKRSGTSNEGIDIVCRKLARQSFRASSVQCLGRDIHDVMHRSSTRMDDRPEKSRKYGCFQRTAVQS